jgi:hypothetical protein
MRDPQDIVDIAGMEQQPAPAPQPARSRRKFLSVWYRCCNVYGRMNRNAAETMYEGRCPRCGARVRARIGPGGTSRRMFEAG